MSDNPAIPAPSRSPDRTTPKPAASTTVPALGRARAFTAWIDLRSHDDPGVRAALRRGVGRDIDDVPFMHRFVASWLTDEQLRDQDVQRAHYAVAALIAAQRRTQYTAAGTAVPGTGETPPEPATANGAAGSAPAAATPYGRSLGRSFADGVGNAGTGGGLREASAEARLGLLTRQSIDGLHRHLPGAVRQLRERGVDVDWAQLLLDLCRWRRNSGEIKRRWLQDYYRALQSEGERRAREADRLIEDAAPEGADTPAA
ncbi:type I-E CRISPR-associated protein Cse2/CasB [Kitasatospora sp. NPDC059973]|uniref:type I-E CRISPR-associated protein Cse2/CasB n=1 Tax=Kitasatospora sp. NPDC059973 TaxID=3347020 RepID=UPI0036C2FF5F